MLSGLDWTTPLKKFEIGAHWRQLLSIGIGAAVATPIWLLAFPFGYWFIKLWAGSVTGATVGMAVGTIWQLRDAGRRARTSGKFIVLGLGGWGVFTAVALFVLTPKLRAQEEQRLLLRSLDPAEITEVLVSVQGTSPRRIQDRATIGAFMALAKDAEVFHPDHEGTLIGFSLTLLRRGQAPLDYQGRVPTGHPADVALEFRAGFASSELLIKDGRKWLEEATR